MVLIKQHNMKKIVLLLLIQFAPIYASAQAMQNFLYNIVTFEGNLDKEALRYCAIL